VREHEVAYCAGLVDGEGTIGINRMRKASSGKYYSRLHVKVTMLDPEGVDALYETFGGSLKQYSNGYFTWYLFGTKAADVIEELLPYLRVKRQQATLAIRFQRYLDLYKYKHDKNLPAGMHAFRSTAAEQLSEMKRQRRQSRYVPESCLKGP
jgi:hypothetical protein